MLEVLCNMIGLELVHIKNKGVKAMGLNEFKDRLFDIINDSDGLPITDIITDDEQDEFRILLDDHSSYTVTCRCSGSWFLMQMRGYKND